MRQSDLREAAALLKALLGSLGATAGGTSLAAADLRQTLGALDADAGTAIAAGTFATALAVCFENARLAGASFVAIDAVRRAAQTLTPSSAAAATVAGAGIQLALACQCRIVADTEFTSRDQIDSWRAILDAAFEAALDAASADFDHAVVVALTSLRAAVIRDLTSRARPLPQIVSYQFARRRPAPWIANRLYGDGGRADELIAENTVVHPLFMPASGRALSR